MTFAKTRHCVGHADIDSRRLLLLLAYAAVLTGFALRCYRLAATRFSLTK